MKPYFHLPKVPIIKGRQDFVIERCRGKKVLHLGCVDSGYLQKKLERKELLHQKLYNVSAELWGVDIDTAGISLLREQGFENLLVGDVHYIDRLLQLKEQRFDIIVATEILEHLMNPGLFLKAIQKVMVPEHTELIISVPNAFGLSRLFHLLRGVEFVHPDHNFWFSYYTLINLLKKSGLEVQEVYVYSYQGVPTILPYRLLYLFRKKGVKTSSANYEVGTSFNIITDTLNYLKSLPKRLLAKFLFSKTPFWGDGIIVVCKKLKK